MNRPFNVTGIILAAGESSRMGRVKQLLPFRGQTILECVIDNAVASDLQRVVVVIGHRADVIEPLISAKDVQIAVNSNFKSGQSSSIRAGLNVLPEGTDAVLFLLGDQPLVTPDIINLLLRAHRESAAPIVLPLFNGVRGNPVLFGRETFRRLELLELDSGARPLFKEYTGRIHQMPVDDASIHFDVDSEEDYRRLLELDLKPPES